MRSAVAGVRGVGGALPHRDAIQQAFGPHDVSSIEAHIGGDAATAAESLDADAYATGNHVAFRAPPDLYTSAHEAAHVVQQRSGVQLKGGLGELGDPHEQHADAVAHAVVAGDSAEALLDSYGEGSSTQQREGNAPVQRYGLDTTEPEVHRPGAEHQRDTGSDYHSLSALVNAVFDIELEILGQWETALKVFKATLEGPTARETGLDRILSRGREFDGMGNGSRLLTNL